MRNRESRPNFEGEGCVRLAVNARLTLLHCSPQFFAWLIFFQLFWFDSVGSIQSIPTTRDASGWRSLPDWLIFYQIHWFWWQGIRLSDGHLAIDNFTLLSSMLCFIDLFWFDSVGSIQSLQVISMARKWVWLTLFSYSCYVCLRNFLLGVNLCLKTQS